jgi:hypothetical protein
MWGTSLSFVSHLNPCFDSRLILSSIRSGGDFCESKSCIASRTPNAQIGAVKILECDWVPKPSHVEGVKKLEAAWMPLHHISPSGCKEKFMRFLDPKP